MISFLQNTYLYIKLCWNVKKYYDHYTEFDQHNMDLLKNITDSITLCGAIAIKFCQWVTPKLELIYLDTNTILTEEDKPKWLTTLEEYYENCPNHSEEYTLQEYQRVFGTNMNDTYVTEKIIGSGSIGQVYLLKHKSTDEECVMKILHPNVKDKVNFFRRFMKLLLFFPCFRNLRNHYFPFDIFEFIRQFEEQTNLIYETNHILHFQKEYSENKFVIIPTPIKISETILLMSYEPGVSFETSELNEYQKDKLANLYHLFIRNNQLIRNYSHGDLHPGNWKIRIEEDNNHKLVVYDFGFCWKIREDLFHKVNRLFMDTFEESNRQNNTVSIDNLCQIIYLLVLYENSDKETGYKERIKLFVISEVENLEPWKLSPIVLLKTIIKFCIQESLLIDPVVVQSFITMIQGQKIFEKYGLMASDKRYISDYEVFRERYLSILTFCKTYNIFPGYSDYIEEKLNDKQLKIDTIFDTVEMDDSIKELALLPN